MARWLVWSTPERAVGVWALAGDIVLCSWVRHLTLTVPLSAQVYKWVPANCWGNLTICGKVICDGLASRPGEVEILLAASCYRNRDKLQQLWTSLGSKASLSQYETRQLNWHRISCCCLGYLCFFLFPLISKLYFSNFIVILYINFVIY